MPCYITASSQTFVIQDSAAAQAFGYSSEQHKQSKSSTAWVANSSSTSIQRAASSIQQPNGRNQNKREEEAEESLLCLGDLGIGVTCKERLMVLRVAVAGRAQVSLAALIQEALARSLPGRLGASRSYVDSVRGTLQK